MTLQLAAVEYGGGPALAILHGLFGAGRNWATIARRLAAHRRVIALDLRNHGASPWADSMDYAALAEDVGATLRAMRALDLGGVKRRGEADALLAATVPDMAERAFLLQNLVFENGTVRW